jgi:hypothetical protein
MADMTDQIENVSLEDVRREINSAPTPAVRRLNLIELPSWNPDEFLKVGRSLFNYQGRRLEDDMEPLFESKDDYPALRRAVHSIQWKLGAAQYQAFEALSAVPDLFEGAVDKWKAAGVAAAMSMARNVEAQPFEIALLICDANMMAAAQTLHSIGDILANVVYLGLRLNEKGRMRAYTRSLDTVTERLWRAGDEAIMCDLLNSLRRAEAFRYLNAFVNTAKHRSLITRRFRLEFNGQRRFGLAIVAFGYQRGKKAPEEFRSKLIDDFLHESLMLMSTAVSDVGKALEQSLARESH